MGLLKNFDSPIDGVLITWYNNTNEVYFEHKVEKGNACHMSHTKYEPI